MSLGVDAWAYTPCDGVRDRLRHCQCGKVASTANDCNLGDRYVLPYEAEPGYRALEDMGNTPDLVVHVIMCPGHPAQAKVNCGVDSFCSPMSISASYSLPSCGVCPSPLIVFQLNRLTPLGDLDHYLSRLTPDRTVICHFLVVTLDNFEPTVRRELSTAPSILFLPLPRNGPLAAVCLDQRAICFGDDRTVLNGRVPGSLLINSPCMHRIFGLGRRTRRSPRACCQG